jgi:RNase P subunit RPR2
MRCEHCHSLMTEQPSVLKMDDGDEEDAIVWECPKCGHTDYQTVITSFWRRLAA